MKRKLTVLAAFLWCALVLSSTASAAVFGSGFGAFKKLVEAGDNDKAAALYVERTQSFAKLKGNKKQYVEQFLESRDATLADELKQQQENLAVAATINERDERWAAQKIAFSRAAEAKAIIETSPATGQLTQQALFALHQDINELHTELTLNATKNLLDYGFYTEPSFQSVYPIQVAWKPTGRTMSYQSEISQLIQQASLEQLKVLKERYNDNLFDVINLQLSLADRYLVLTGIIDDITDIAGTFAVWKQLAQAGWISSFDVYLKERVLMLTWKDAVSLSDELKGVKDITEPVVRHLLLEQEPARGALMYNKEMEQFDLIVMAQTLFSTQSDVQKTKKQSEYEAGTRQVINEEYSDLQRRLNDARAELSAEKRKQNQRSSDPNAYWTQQNSYNIGTALVESVKEYEIEQLTNRLNSTPRLVEEPIMRSYEYNETALTVEKTREDSLIAIDKVARHVWQPQKRVTKVKETFLSGGGLLQEDPSEGQLRRFYNSEKERFATFLADNVVDHRGLWLHLQKEIEESQSNVDCFIFCYD